MSALSLDERQLHGWEGPGHGLRRPQARFLLRPCPAGHLEHESPIQPNGVKHTHLQPQTRPEVGRIHVLQWGLTPEVLGGKGVNSAPSFTSRLERTDSV